MKKLQLTLLLLTLCLVPFEVSAQHFFLSSHINSSNGLPQNTIRDIAFCNNGFVWLATEDGLVRYDGIKTVVFNTQNAALKKNRIIKFLSSADKRLFFVDEDHNIIEIIESSPSVQFAYISKFPFTGYNSFHLFEIQNLQEFKEIHQLLLKQNTRLSKSCFFILNKLNKIVQRCDDGILIYSNKKVFLKKILIPRSPQNDYFIHQDELYVCTEDKVIHHINTDNEVISRLNTPSGFSQMGKLFLDNRIQQSFWIQDNSLFLVQIKHHELHLKPLIKTLPSQNIYSILYNQELNTVFLGTLDNGLYIYNNSYFTILQNSNGDNNFYAQSIVHPNKDIITGNLYIFKKNNTIVNGAGSTTINGYALYTDTNHHVWFGFSNKLLKYQPTHGKITTAGSFDDVDDNQINVISKLNDSALFLSTSKAIYQYRATDGITKLANFNFPKRHSQSYCILEQGDSSLLLGTSNGIYTFHKATHKLSPYCLSGEIVRTLYRSRSGIILAGTYGNGYYAIIDHQIHKIPIDINNHLKSVHSFREDQRGFVWMSCNEGLFRVKIKEIEAYTNNKAKSKLYYFRYSTHDGLVTNEFNGGCYPSSLSIDSVTWSFPTVQGLVVFNPMQITQRREYPSIFIDKILLNGDEIKIDNRTIQITPPNHQFKLQVFVSSPNWSDEENLQIEYCLAEDTAKHKWELLKNPRSPITIQNIAGGPHKLIIRKRSFNGEQNRLCNLDIYVPLLWSERAWFKPLLVCLILVLGYLIYLFSNYYLLRKKEKLERLVNERTSELKAAVHLLEVQNAMIKKSEEEIKKESEFKSNLLFLLTHDIATPLRFLNMILARYQIENYKPIQLEDFRDLRISTINLENLLDNIVTWMKQALHENIKPQLSKFNLHTLVEEKINLFNIITKTRENHVTNAIPLSCQIHSDEFIISMALQNILGNAIQHTRKGEIEITFVEMDNGFKICVLDNGIGILKAKNANRNDALLGYGIGLKITQELLGLIQAEVKVEPREREGGTISCICIKKNNTI